jgi:phage tail sheath protein FI
LLDLALCHYSDTHLKGERVPIPIRPIHPIRPIPTPTLEQTIELHLQASLAFATGQPNAEPLWNSIRLVASDYLMTLFLSGTLKGAKPEEAYFVRCDRTTMTQNDIDNGRIIVLVGFAPTQPAEFVVIRIALMTATQP